MTKFPKYTEEIISNGVDLKVTFRDMGEEDYPEFICAKTFHGDDVSGLLGEASRDLLAMEAIEQMEERARDSMSGL